MNESVFSHHIEKDAVKEEFDKLANLDPEVRNIYELTSRKTVDLLSSLNDIKTKNRLIFGKKNGEGKSSLPAPVDLFDNPMLKEPSLEDVAAEIERMGQNGRFIM